MSTLKFKLQLGKKPPDFNNPPTLAFPLYKSHGLFYHKLERYHTAKMYYNKAMELDPENESPLIERSKANIQTAEYAQALEDALAALSINSSNLHAVFMRATSLYMLSDIEIAIVQFFRGLHQRKKPPLFDEGVLGAAETEDICIGRHVGPILLQHLEEIKLLDEKRKKELALARKKFSYRSKDKYISPSEGSDSSASIIEDWGTQRKMESIVSSRYLGRMHQDLYFLKHLEKDPRIHDGQRGYAKTLASLMKKTLDVVTHTKEILRVRQPFYAVNRMDETYAESLRERRKIQLLKKIVEHTSTANKLLDRTRKERESGSSKRFIECVLKVKEYLYQTPIKLLPNKQQYLDILYNITGLAYLDHLKLEAYIDKSDAFAQVEEYYGIQKDPNQPLPSRRMTHILLDYRQILANCEASLEISRSELEKVWLYYEIAKANHELGNKSEIARTAIKKSIREAKSLRNLVWNINSCVLASRIEMKSQARTEARLLLQDALDCAKKMGNESVVDFLEVCYDVVENSSNEVPADMIEVRQKRILSVMATEKQRTTVAGLFNYMDTLPTARRMSIVPGVKQNSVKRRLSKVAKTSGTGSFSKMRAVAFQAA